jgi:hypothetical protein
MFAERPRARRYAFQAHIELVDVKSEAVTNNRTSNLSLFGCHVEPPRAHALGAKVRVRITYKGSVFTASGRIANIRANGDVGVAFTDVSEKDQRVLEKWMAQLRHDAEGHPKASHPAAM